VFECGNILQGGGVFSRDILDMKWAMELRFVSNMMLDVGINHGRKFFRSYLVLLDVRRCGLWTTSCLPVVLFSGMCLFSDLYKIGR
jgi:hypothetical protein